MLLLQVLACQLVATPPVWFMRQAGRYLPEYQKVRANFTNFIEFCLTPDAATQVTLQPITRFDLDAAIIFADILTIPYALGHSVSFSAGHGPNVQKITELSQITALQNHLQNIPEKLANIAQTMRQVRAELPAQKAVIGFSGAPFTLATYMLDAKPSIGIPNTLKLAAEHPEQFQQLIKILTQSIISYLSMQINAGANVVQLFDSWAGACPEHLWHTAVHAPLSTLTQTLKNQHPQTPVIVFARGANTTQLQTMATSIPAALGLATEVDIAWASTNLQPHTAIQGNIDPLLFTEESPANLLKSIAHIKNTAATKPGFVWNLGHGFTPQTIISHVQLAVDTIRS